MTDSHKELPIYRVTIELIRPGIGPYARNHVNVRTLDTGRVPVDRVGIDVLHPRCQIDLVSNAFHIEVIS
jgi:hypothetical protein